MRQIVKGLAVALTILAAGTGWGTDVSAANDGRAPGPMQQLAESILTDIGQASWIAEGKGPHVVYIFFDPNCPYCHNLYINTRAQVKAGKLQLRWIPVGILVTTSHGKAGAMLGSKDPLKAFYQNEDHYDRSAGGGGLNEDLVTPEVDKKLQANENLLARTRVGAVPLMLFHADNGTPILVQGAPPKDKLANLLGHVK